MLQTFYTILNKCKPSWLTFHPTCLLCLAVVKESKLMICDNCYNDLPMIIQACNCCGLPIPHIGLCGQCLKTAPSYHRIIAPYRYEFPIAQLITQFKYNKQWPIGHLLANLLIARLCDNYNKGLSKPDYLIAVPLSKNRLKERGFNQAELLATWLNKKLAIPLANESLQRVIDTPPQQTLSAKERHKNLKNAFKLIDASLIVNQHIAIIDDVVTTGSTANTLALLLIHAGAKQVDIYAIARTPHTFK